MFHFARLTIVLLAGVVLSGCAGDPGLGGAPTIQVVQAEALPAPSHDDLAATDRAYTVGPRDQLRISVFGVEDLKVDRAQVDMAGNIAFPLAGDVKALGLTPEQLSAEIAARLRKYVRNPQVTTSVLEIESQVFTVDGQVKLPGSYPVIGRTSLMRAIASAQGQSEFAKLDDVVVFRTVGGQKMAALYNLRAIRRGAYTDPEIYANDVIVVGDSPSRRMFDKFMQAASILTTPVVVLIQSL